MYWRWSWSWSWRLRWSSLTGGERTGPGLHSDSSPLTRLCQYRDTAAWLQYSRTHTDTDQSSPGGSQPGSSVWKYLKFSHILLTSPSHLPSLTWWCRSHRDSPGVPGCPRWRRACHTAQWTSRTPPATPAPSSLLPALAGSSDQSWGGNMTEI